MKYVVSGTEMKKVDSYTINKVGIPSLVLMERAAFSVADFICKKELINSTVLAVCGTGNNGADAIAVARILYQKGFGACIYIVGDIEKATDQFKTQLNIAKNIGVPTTGQFVKTDIVVDGIFGVGLSRNVEGIYSEVIELINEGRNTVYAVDIPSGIDADTGKTLGCAIKANYTITFGNYKIGTLLYPGADYCGVVSIADIGFPSTAYKETPLIFTVDKEDLELIPPRPNYSNKGTFGKVLIVAGSKDITGAAYLCAKAAFRVGAGLVRIFTANENRDVIERLIPEAIVNTYDTEKFDQHALEASLNWCDVVAAGPGMATGSIQSNIIETILDSGKPAVIDADGINNISANEKLKKKLHNNIIITPHLGEMSRLLNVSIEDIQNDIIRYSRKANNKYNIVSVLKDARTVIATDKGTYINDTGNNGMATAGSGDVLTGVIVGLMAIGTELKYAAVLGPYIHGMAGDMAAKNISQASLMASDIIEQLAILFKQ